MNSNGGAYYTYNLADEDDVFPSFNDDSEEPNKQSNVNEVLEEPSIEDNVNEDVKMNEIVMDYTNVFTNLNYFPTRQDLQEWVRVVAKEQNMVIVVSRSDNGSGKKKARVFMACERGGQYRKFKGRGNKKLKKTNMNDDIEVEVGEGEEEDEEEKKKNTGTEKCGCPFLLKGTQVSPTEWQLEVKNGFHNHPVALFLEGHSYAGRLTPNEEEFVLDMSHANAPAKDVLNALKKKNRDNHSTIRTIYNARKKHRVTEFCGRSQLQHLMGLLVENGYVQHSRRCHETNTLLELFFAHPTGIQLFRAFPSVLLLDATYKTNKFRLPFLEMVGVTSTGKTFSVASVFLQAEKQDNFTWALGLLRDVLDDACHPRVILTDREMALMNALDEKFPEAKHFLCTWHIDRNVLAKYKGKFDTDEGWNAFYLSWRDVMFADTEKDFTNAIRHLHEVYSTNSKEKEAVDYVMNQWVTPYKEKFVSAWTNEVMHYDNTTTNRVESHHAALKRSLGNSLGNFQTCWARADTLFGACHNTIKESFEKSANVAQHRFKPVIYKDLRGVISLYALDKLYVEVKRIKSGESNPLTCNHYLRKVCGLPCTHELSEYLKEGTPIPLDAIDRYWRKLDMEPMLRADVGDVCAEDMDNRFDDAILALVGRYKDMDSSQKRVLLRQAVELVNPVTTSMVEPYPKINVRGRPKVKSKQNRLESSTKRDPSLFEYQQSMNGSCTVEEVVIMVSDTCPTPVFVKKQQATKTPIIRKSTQFDESKSFIPLLPIQYQPYIVACKDVDGDGHCGFRAVAGLMNFKEKMCWARVRQDLMNELGHNMYLYQGVFRENDRVGMISQALNCFTASAQFSHWFQLPYMGYLVASVYNLAFIVLSNTMSLTFLPLRSELPKQPTSICVGHVNNNHFIQVTLAKGSPMAPIADSWKTHHKSVADGWKIAYDNHQIS